MLPGIIADMIAPPVSGGGGGGPSLWDDITSSSTAPVSGQNSNRTMTAAGTLNFSHSVSGPGFSYRVFKNGVDQGQITSMAVIVGDAVRFSALKTAGAVGSITEGPFYVSGAASDSFYIYLERAA